MKLDFSGISTEHLKIAVDSATRFDGFDDFCKGIYCDSRCPFHVVPLGCEKKSSTIRRVFKEELNRREKDMNKQPTLEAGMIVEFSSSKNKFLYIKKGWSMCLENDEWTSADNECIVNIYTHNHYSKTYKDSGKGLKLIWSRKSDKDIEIEEIQKEMDKLSKRMEGLKSV